MTKQRADEIEKGLQASIAELLAELETIQVRSHAHACLINQKLGTFYDTLMLRRSFHLLDIKMCLFCCL